MSTEQKRVKKGWLAVRVGREEDGFHRFMIPISHLYHPQFRELLEAAREVYGYHSSGPLMLPCSVDDFLRLCRLVEREDQRRQSHGHQRQLRPSSFPFPS